MYRLAVFAYGVICYAVFFATFLYAVGFLGDFGVPKSVDSGTAGPKDVAVLINLMLLGLFGVQHTVMARPGFKAVWTKLVPVQVERSTYVLVSSAVLILLFWQWRPLPDAVWSLREGAGYWILRSLFFGGFLIVLYASFLIDHFDLFGLRQVFLYFRGIKYTHPPFGTPGMYKLVRHPLYVGWITAFWCTPIMTQGHLLFAAVATGYIFIAIVFEERDLVRFIGPAYQQYRARVPMFLPWPRRQPAVVAVETTDPAVSRLR